MNELDLSAEIIVSLARQPGERITCRRVTTNFYRCNWWAAQSVCNFDNPVMPGPLATASRICRSQFLLR